MKKKKAFLGLKFNYKINDQILMNKFLTIEDFLKTYFPKNNNPLSPDNNTEIFNIRWNMKLIDFKGQTVNTVNNLKKFLSINQEIKPIENIQMKLERKSIYSIDQVKELTKNVLFERIKKNTLVELDGDLIKGNSQRYQVFFTKGLRCTCCGVEGKYFAKEKDKNARSYHLNLYGIDENGKEVLITKDHIIPKSKGGRDNLDNYQTMCIRCNQAKADKL